MITSSNFRSLLSRAVALSLVVSFLSVQATISFASPATRVISAELTVSGQAARGEKPYVLVNGEQAFSGRTFFSNRNIATTETTSATISLGRLGRIDLAPSSSLNLEFSEGRIAGVLSTGSVSVVSSEGVSVKIDTPDDSVTNKENSPSRFSVAVVDGRTGVAVQSGTLRNGRGSEIKPQDDDDDDDDDDDWKTAAAWIAVIGGAVVAVVLIATLGDDDDDTVSPVR
jgi:hypothetical protein